MYYGIKSKYTLARLKTDFCTKRAVYYIKHISSGKVYIGSSFYLHRRLTDHIDNRNSKLHLQDALNKYGIYKFCICIL